MSDEIEDALEDVYHELKKARDQIKLRLHLGGMDLRDQWQDLEKDWDAWVGEVGGALKAGGDELEVKLKEAGGDDLKKIEIKTRVAISKMKRGLRDLAEKLGEEEA